MAHASELSPSGFIRQLPKAELHLHLEGSIDPHTLAELRARHGKTADSAELDELYHYETFADFLRSFKLVTKELETPEDFELITHRLMEKLHAENVLHAEVYISVGVYLWRKQDFAAIFEGLERGRQRGEREFGVSLLWIFDAVRQFGRAEAERVAELAVSYKNRSVVGFGTGGDELQGPAEMFREVYAYLEKHGLRLTAHAGENAGPDSIWGALNLHAERIGHGLTAYQDPELVEELSKRQIPVEICFTSNLLTRCCPSIREHPIRNYFDQGVMITLNTDDPAMFSTSLSREYQLAQNHFGFTDEHLRELARNSFEASFLPAAEKLKFLNLFDGRRAR